MTEIKWLETSKNGKTYLSIPGADVYISKIKMGDKDGQTKYKTHIYFVNNGEKKVTQGSYIMVGLSDQYIFLKDGSDIGASRKICRPTNKNGKPYIAIPVDLDGAFGPNVRSFYNKAFRLQLSNTNKAWFIAHTGEVKQKEVL